MTRISPLAAIALPKPKRPLLKAYRQEEVRCLRVLCDYLHLLERWKVQHAPKTPEDVLDDRFVEACQMLDYVEYLADLLIAAELEQRVKIVGNAEQGWPDCQVWRNGWNG